MIFLVSNDQHNTKPTALYYQVAFWLLITILQYKFLLEFFWFELALISKILFLEGKKRFPM